MALIEIAVEVFRRRGSILTREELVDLNDFEPHGFGESCPDLVADGLAGGHKSNGGLRSCREHDLDRLGFVQVSS